MPTAAEPADASLAQAKAALIVAAKAIDPLAPLRRSPFVTVGVAAGVGAVLGMSHGRPMASAGLTQAISSFVRLAASAIGRYVQARASQAATETRKEPAPAPTQELLL